MAAVTPAGGRLARGRLRFAAGNGDGGQKLPAPEVWSNADELDPGDVVVDEDTTFAVERTAATTASSWAAGGGDVPQSDTDQLGDDSSRLQSVGSTSDMRRSSRRQSRLIKHSSSRQKLLRFAISCRRMLDMLQIGDGSRSESDYIFGFKVERWSQFWKPALVVVIMVMVLGTVAGAVTDAIMFDGWTSVCYTQVAAAFSLAGAMLVILRVVLLRCAKGRSSIEEIMDFAVFIPFMLLVHVLAASIIDQDWAVGQLQINQRLAMTSTIRELIANEEFLPQDVPNFGKTLLDVSSTDEMWQFLQGPFVENVFTCGGDDELPAEAPRFGFCDLADGKLFRLGSVRIRTIRVAAEPCNIGLVDGQTIPGTPTAGKACKPDVTPEGNTVDKEPRTLPACTLPGAIPQPMMTTYSDGSYKNFQGTPKDGRQHVGAYATYPAGGHVFTLQDDVALQNASFPLDAGNLTGVTAAERKRRIMQCLQQQGLVDDYTRALFVTSTMYSVSAARYVQTNVFFEFSSYGGITARLDLMAGSMPDLTCMNEYHDRQMWFLPQGPCGNNQRCLDINNSTFNSRGTMKAGYIGSRLPYIKLADGSTRPRSTEREKFDHESYQLWAEPRYRMGMGLPYISSRMHYCYAFAVMFFMYFLVQEVEELVELGPFEYLGSFWNIYDLATLVCLFVTLLLDSFGKNHTPSPDAELYYEWNTANMWFDRAGSAGALCVLMVWIKVFKYMVWLPNFAILSKTLSAAAPALMSLFVFLLVFLLGFSYSMFLLLGPDTDNYGSVSNSLFTMFRALSGDLDWVEVWEKTVTYGNLGTMFAVFFQCLMVFVLLTMFIAIISEKFAAARIVDRDSREFIRKWVRRVRPPRSGKHGSVRVAVYNATGLAIGDELTATSDPYVKIILASKTCDVQQDREKAYRSKTRRSTRDPVWDGKTKFECDVHDRYLILSVYDEDTLTNDDFLGQVVVDLHALPADGTVVSRSDQLAPLTRCPRTGKRVENPVDIKPASSAHVAGRRRAHLTAEQRAMYGNTLVIPTGELHYEIGYLSIQ